MPRKRWLAWGAVLCLVGLLLTACTLPTTNFTPPTKKADGYITENGDVTLNGAVYKRLPNVRRSDAFSPCYDETVRKVYLSEENQPSLLFYLLDGSGVILENPYSKETVNSEFYCREDRYDTVLKWINEGAEYTHYGYTLGEDSPLEWYSEKIYLGTAELTDVIDRVRATVTPRKGDVSLIRGECLYLLMATEDYLFVAHASMAIIEDGGTYTLVDYNGDTTYSYPIPAADSGPVKALYDQWVNSGGVSVEYYGDYY